jgi:hypothetical protein
VLLALLIPLVPFYFPSPFFTKCGMLLWASFHPVWGGCMMPDLSMIRFNVFSLAFSSRPCCVSTGRFYVKCGPQYRPYKGMKNGAFIQAIQDSFR